MVEFCPRCGSVLVPSKRNGKAYLVCGSCGYSRQVKSSSSYIRRERISEDRKTKVAVLERGERKGKEKLEEERELLQEYYEVFLDTMEGETSEEE
ncbi:MAG: DNA-directed RNA polymerase subunit M [Thermoprotei archaeon]|nr:MAG: DNA-directed RNA polymerase subunit M [Thermoprotei archaeon]